MFDFAKKRPGVPRQKVYEELAVFVTCVLEGPECRFGMNKDMGSAPLVW